MQSITMKFEFNTESLSENDLSEISDQIALAVRDNIWKEFGYYRLSDEEQDKNETYAEIDELLDITTTDLVVKYPTINRFKEKK